MASNATTSNSTTAHLAVGGKPIAIQSGSGTADDPYELEPIAGVTDLPVTDNGSTAAPSNQSGASGQGAPRTPVAQPPAPGASDTIGSIISGFGSGLSAFMESPG